MKLLNFANLNVRGVKNNEGSPTGSELSNIIKDCEKQNIDAMQKLILALKHLQEEKGYTAFSATKKTTDTTGIRIEETPYTTN